MWVLGAGGWFCLVRMSRSFRFLSVRSRNVGGDGQSVLSVGSVSVVFHVCRICCLSVVSLGLNGILKVVFLVFCLILSLSSCDLGMSLALWICCRISRGGYPLARNIDLSVLSSLSSW